MSGSPATSRESSAASSNSSTNNRDRQASPAGLLAELRISNPNYYQNLQMNQSQSSQSYYPNPLQTTPPTAGYPPMTRPSSGHNPPLQTSFSTASGDSRATTPGTPNSPLHFPHAASQGQLAAPIPGPGPYAGTGIGPISGLGHGPGPGQGQYVHNQYAMTPTGSTPVLAPSSSPIHTHNANAHHHNSPGSSSDVSGTPGIPGGAGAVSAPSSAHGRRTGKPGSAKPRPGLTPILQPTGAVAGASGPQSAAGAFAGSHSIPDGAVGRPGDFAEPRVLTSLNDHTVATVNGTKYNIYATELKSIETIGRGQYGTVEKMRHANSGLQFAVKKIRAPTSSDEHDKSTMKTTLMELAVLADADCQSLVRFYGALFREGDVWLLMELMDISLDRFYRQIFDLGKRFPENILGMIFYDVVGGLDYLKRAKNILHRDIKPSNILVSRDGRAAICDFGISGALVNSLAKTDIGCKPYMAPERIDPKKEQQYYGVQSDVWSLGITIFEVATGKFPYGNWKNPFEQLKEVVQGDPPRLPANDPYFSNDLRDFVATCLDKDFKTRPKYQSLFQHPFLKKYEKHGLDEIGEFVCKILDETAQIRAPGANAVPTHSPQQQPR